MLDFFAHIHPLILHLPIGFLAIAFLMHLIKREEFIPAIGFTLKYGMLAALIAAASGYFLSNDGGYDKDLLFWHQWLGMATAAFSVILFYLFKSNGRAFSWVFFATMLLLIGAGHFGGSLTHGSGFLFESFQEKELKPLIANVDDALVFQDFIQPIFNEKCNSCHNPSKKKGQLLMTTKEGILKGGKTGDLFVAGNIGESLMFERIHMEEAEKEHMPPKGKKQLSEEEIKLLEWWVAAGADFDKTVAETNTPEEIKSILNKYVKPEKDAGILALDVEAASENKLNKVREAGFKIDRIAQNSPFLEAVFPKNKTLKKTDLKTLKNVSEQLIWLDLNGSNVDDDMIAVVNDLPHLQKLFLQNTKVTDKGLRYLKGLDYLEYLNLYGTEITDKGLETLPELPRLQNIYLWKTQTTEDGIALLKNKMPYLNIDMGADQAVFGDAELMPPLIVAASDIFKDTLSVELKMNFAGAQVFYTLDGSEPDSNSLKYEGEPIVLSTSTEVKAFAKKAGWKSSEPVSQFFPRAKYEFKKLNISPQPSDKYKGKGAVTLHDLEKGSLAFTDNNWLGYEKSHATVTIDLGEKKEVSRVTVGALESTGSYIFFPKGLEVSVSDDGQRFKTVASKTYPTTDGPKPAELANFSVAFQPENARFIKVFIRSNLVNPDWHPAPGAGCWIFLDEVIVE
ncbi:MAG: chitobiase/beta-hexosaminidase C-terminal domain-containing protein [Saprospiraceae bacterium]